MNMHEIITRYSVRYDAKIKKICKPLTQYLGIPYFTYYYVDENGHFATLSNATEFMDYYYAEEYYINNPYMAHPDLFQSGQLMSPCALDVNQQQKLRHRFDADHLFRNPFAASVKPF